MNQTEAWEWIVTASETMVQKADEQGMLDEGIENLRRALNRVKPRVERMRSRLDHLRARRAGKPRCPKGLEP